MEPGVGRQRDRMVVLVPFGGDAEVRQSVIEQSGTVQALFLDVRHGHRVQANVLTVRVLVPLLPEFIRDTEVLGRRSDERIRRKILSGIFCIRPVRRERQ